MSKLLHPISYEIDTQAELNAEPYEQALQVLSPSNVLATVDDLGSPIVHAHDHPLQALVEHCLQFGPTRRSKKRPYVSETGGSRYEPLIQAAITRLVAEKLADFGAWED